MLYNYKGIYMIKYTSLLIVAFLMLGCGSKANIETPKTTTETAENVIQESKNKVKTVTKAPSLPAGFKEEKKLRAIGANVPSTCQEWSDGCNSCARAGNGQASCTIYTCDNKAPFSCLKWQ